ncbi:threonyl-tRNA synthetase [Methanocaldococcus infernus ME]|uniref:Threonine--tRNA ligase n=1 Tax=Methanocaldococcus infernus (strain DSM 11812 / JCM 15783 / ME) TaxID=573063 RepID=D5VU39_METIM|nr:threonine--tRNA ligase [Methanocaldococcus infernus]ADG14092.1 threonyl-tRNA synthetase [Methanocaldococcus infernus ME]
MRMLLIHSDYLEFEAKEKTKIAEDTENLKGKLEECLVSFIAVEREDESNVKGIIDKAVEEIKKVAEKLKVKNIVIYPYAHLSSNLSSPETALEVLKGIEKELKKEFNVLRAPFGWYKAFKLSCKGHPLSELSRKIVPEEEKKEKEEVESEFYLIKDGELIKIDKDNLKVIENKYLRQLAKYELGIRESLEKEPKHVKLIKEKEICSNEEASDLGHFRWYPKGKLIRDLIADYVYYLVLSHGAMPVETPVMYDLNNKAIKEHADKFGERQYRFRMGNKELMLRFAACFGQFMIKKDMYLLPKYLPLKLYELSTYSFRYEQSGELVGLKRLRAFTMPDMHTVCLNLEQAMEEFEKQFWMCLKTGEDLELDYYVIFRFTKDFFEEHKDWFLRMAKEYKERYNKDLLLEILPKRKHYWVGKVDIAVIDSLGRPIENPTVQIDVESSKRFDIKVHADKEIYPIILHCSPTGSIERVICALLERDMELPYFPIWLSPIQVRVISVSEKYNEYAENIVKELIKNNIRADLDDRDLRVGKKIREAGKDWVPYVVVVGEEEVKGNKLTVTIREKSTLKEPYKVKMSLEELIKEVKEKCKDKPFRPLPLPYKVSLQPKFN